MQQNFNLGKVPKKFSYATWNEGDKVLKKFKQQQKKNHVILYSILSRRQIIGQECGWIKDFDRCFRMLYSVMSEPLLPEKFEVDIS